MDKIDIMVYNDIMKIVFAGMHINVKSREFHTHDTWEIIYCTSGSGRFIVKNEPPINYGTGDIIIVAPNVMHSNMSDSTFSNFYLLVENATLLYDKVIIVKDNTGNFLVNTLQQIYHVFSSSLTNKQEIMFHLGAMASSFIKNIGTTTPTSPLINKIKMIINENLSDINFNVGELLDSSHPSPEYLRKKFKEETGQTPLQYLTDTRLNYAQSLLKIKYDLKLNIAEIASMSGFSDPLYFSRIYKKHFKVSPKDQA